MTKEQKKVIEKIKRQITIGECEKNIGIPVYISDLKTVLSELEKKDKMIDEMAKYVEFEKMDFNCSPMCIHEGCIEECIKEYFTNKVEREGK